LSTNHFANWSFCQQVILSTGHFVDTIIRQTATKLSFPARKKLGYHIWQIELDPPTPESCFPIGLKHNLHYSNIVFALNLISFPKLLNSEYFKDMQ
jgi:hypothetical protein